MEKNILCVPNLILVHIYLVEEHRLSIKGVNGFADDSWSERPPMLRPSVRWEKDRSLKLWSELSFLICAGQEQESLGVMRSVSVHCETFVNFGASTVHFCSGRWVLVGEWGNLGRWSYWPFQQSGQLASRSGSRWCFISRCTTSQEWNGLKGQSFPWPCKATAR